MSFFVFSSCCTTACFSLPHFCARLFASAFFGSRPAASLARAMASSSLPSATRPLAFCSLSLASLAFFEPSRSFCETLMVTEREASPTWSPSPLATLSTTVYVPVSLQFILISSPEPGMPQLPAGSIAQRYLAPESAGVTAAFMNTSWWTANCWSPTSTRPGQAPPSWVSHFQTFGLGPR